MNFKQLRFFTLVVPLALSVIFLAGTSCKHEGIPADQFPEICFQGQILPIFQNSCATCHSGAHGGAGQDFSTYAGIMKAITPGNADKSKAYQAITSTFQIMPPNNALPEEKRILVRIWIEQGAKETSCSTTGTSTATTTSDAQIQWGHDNLSISGKTYGLAALQRKGELTARPPLAASANNIYQIALPVNRDFN